MKSPFILTLALACLMGGVATGGAAAGAESDAPQPAAKKIDWERMTTAQRKKYMKATVLPQMKKLFVAFDKKYKNMSCQTCHGEKAAENKYKMPNAELPKLPQPTNRAGFMALQQKKPEAVKFMGTKVKPTMAALLGLPEWSPSNTTGFGCYECHTKEGEGSEGNAPSGAAPPAPAAPSGGTGW